MARPSKAEVAAKEAALAEKIATAVATGIESARATIRAEIEEDVARQLMAARELAGGVAPAADPGIHDMTKARTAEGDKGLVTSLALAIANLSSQGTGKQELIDPEILETRAQARKRMVDLLVKARAEENIPTYRVIGEKGCFFNETKIQPQWFDPVTKAMKDTEIYWDEVPNESLEPTNDIATEVFAAFMESIGETTEKRPAEAVSWVRTEKRLFRGMKGEQRDALYSKGIGDIRVEGKGGQMAGKRQNIMGTVAAPIVMR